MLGEAKCAGQSSVSVSAIRASIAWRVRADWPGSSHARHDHSGRSNCSGWWITSPCHQAACGSRRQVQHHVPRGMTGGRLDPHAVVDLVVILDDQCLPRLDDRQHAVLEHPRNRHCLAVPVSPQPGLVLRAREDVPGVGEGRNPASVDEPGVPPDVIDVQVGTQHEVDVLRRRPRQRQGPPATAGPACATWAGPAGACGCRRRYRRGWCDDGCG